MKLPTGKIALLALSGAVLVLSTQVIRMKRQLETARQQSNELQPFRSPPSPVQFFPSNTASSENPGGANVAASGGTYETPAEAELVGHSLPKLVAGNQDNVRLEAQKRAYNQYRPVLPREFPDLDKALNLSPEEMDRLFDLIAKQRTGPPRFNLNGVDLSDPAQVIKHQEQASEDEIAALLGNKYSKWQEYKYALPFVQQLSDLQTDLGAGDLSLNSAQVNSLRAALISMQKLIDSNPAPRGAQNAKLPFSEKYTEETRQEYLQTAARYLSPQQLSAYQQLLQRMSDAEQERVRSYNAAFAAGPPPAPR